MTTEKAAQGGAVENAAQPPGDPNSPARERYELHDPFAETTYRLNSYRDMVAKAEELGAVRFHAIAPNGERTPIMHVEGVWKRPDTTLTAARAQHDERTPIQAPEATRDHRDASPARGRHADDAERTSRVAAIEAALEERYLVRRSPLTVGDVSIGRTEYRFRGDATRVAFTESSRRLATDTNSPSVARSMVDVAESRHWKTIRISGSEDFRRMVWLEASLRGVRSVGYEPQASDRHLLQQERDSRARNRIEPEQVSARGAKDTAVKSSARGSSGRKSVLVALEAVMVSKGVPAETRAAVMSAATEKLARRIDAGEVHKVKVYDRAAPSLRAATPTREVQRSPDRPGPTR